MPKGTMKKPPAITVGGYGEWASIRPGRTESGIREVRGSGNVRSAIRTTVGDRMADKLISKAQTAGWSDYPGMGPTSLQVSRGKAALPSRKKKPK